MSEEVKEELQDVILEIRLKPDCSFKINGAVIHNEPIALYMLEKAKDMIKAENLMLQMKAQSKIVKPGIMDFVKGRR